MKANYITSDFALPSCIAFPRFLLGMNIRLISKEVYAILLDMLNDQRNARVDEQGRCYLSFTNNTIAQLIDRTPSTVGHSLIDLERAGLIERRLIGRNLPYHIYVKLPKGEIKQEEYMVYV